MCTLCALCVMTNVWMRVGIVHVVVVSWCVRVVWLICAPVCGSCVLCVFPMCVIEFGCFVLAALRVYACLLICTCVIIMCALLCAWCVRVSV